MHFSLKKTKFPDPTVDLAAANNTVYFSDFQSHILQKVCHYLAYKTKYRHSRVAPPFDIPPDIAMDLLAAANELECWVFFEIVEIFEINLQFSNKVFDFSTFFNFVLFESIRLVSSFITFLTSVIYEFTKIQVILTISHTEYIISRQLGRNVMYP